MKVANSYASLLRGVSQQVPQDRADGQHTEQVNMLSDPVNGLTRRHGSRWLAEKALVGLAAADMAAITTDTNNWTSLDFDTGGKEYTVLMRRAGRVVTTLPPIIVYNKTDGVFLDNVRDVADTALNTLEANGIAAATAVGKYIFSTANGVPISGTSTARWDTATNLSRAVVWIRGGAFSRKYSVKVRKQDGTLITTTYTTPSSSYQGVLDTSDILTGDPDYTKKVNDRVNAYNAAVTQWIGTSTAAVQPDAIAQTLATQLVAAGLTGTTVVGSHVVFPETLLVKSLEVDDGGDGSLIRGVADEIESADKTSVVHFVGKVVKVRSRNAAEAYYLKAVAKDKRVTTGYTEVTWIEGAGVEHAITGGLFYATIADGVCYLASNAYILTDLTVPGPPIPDLPPVHPTFSVSTAGDADSAPAPFFVGKQVSYLGTFQNRLLVGCGGVLAVSKTEDYLNFFRSTVLTLPGDDAFDMQPTGSEDDTLRHSVLYDQNLVIFGAKRQYIIRGNVPLTPTSANMAVMANYEGVVDASPVAAGGFIMYAKRGESSTSVHQVQPGQTENTPESFPASSQLSDYISGGIIEMASATGSPSLLFSRATGKRDSVYVFAYLDRPDGRKMDSWNRWEFNSALGVIVGMSIVTDGIQLYSIRVGASGAVYVVADLVPTTTLLSAKPYLDSHRPIAQVQAGTGSVTTLSGASWAAAFDSTSPRRFTGATLPNLAALTASYPGEPGLTVGATYSSYFVPTNPFMRDGKDKAIISGRLTVTRMIVAFKESTGFSWTLKYRTEPEVEETFNGRILGDPENLIGVEPVSTGQHSIGVGRETRDYTLRISSRRWYPLTVTALEWVGQFFNRVQRF